jgi:ubiquinone/menaquinone biosynthesis C-methylase UbiE
MKSFDKYNKKGAYHWNALYGEGWLRASPRLHARYDIPIHLLRERIDLGNSRGLDVGCGDGVLIYKVRKMGGQLFGLDKEPEGLRLAERKLESHGVFSDGLIEGSCYDIPLETSSLDYVTAIELIEHLDDVDSFLEEIYRVLRPSGWFVCTTPNRERDQDPSEVRDPFHVHEYVPDELQSSLSNFFGQVQVYGAYPEKLDAIYVRNRRSSFFDKAIRVLFRSFSFGVANPYVHWLENDPDRDFNMIVGVARKGEILNE